MKKTYNKLELELVMIDEDIVTASGTTYTFKDGNLFDDVDGQTWNW